MTFFPGEIQHGTTSVAVGAVIDDTVFSDDDLPVVVAVGINYWQFGKNSQPWVKQGWRATKMRRRLDEAMRMLDGKCGFKSADRYHLVAVNFFPWITRSPWSNIPNSLTEALALYCWGIPKAPELIATLIKQLDTGAAEAAPIVAMHGVNNAVPALSLRVVQSVNEPTPSSVRFIYSDNLGYAAPPRNVAVLSNSIRRHLTRRVMDD